jgi:F-type H+-transporting ATPase subunit b
MFNVDSGLIVWEIITFILLLGVLRLYAWKPLLVALKKRETAIAEALEKTDQAKRDAESLLRSSRDALRQTNLAFERIRQRSEPVIHQIKDAAVVAAEAEVNRILSETKEEIQRLKRRAIQQLREEIGGLVIECATVVIDNTLDPPRHRKLIENALRSLPPNGVSSFKEFKNLDLVEPE